MFHAFRPWVHAMTTRRQFIEGAMATGIAAASVPAGATALGLTGAGGSYLRLERVIFDERFADAIAFAAVARRQSVATSAVKGSIHDLWYQDLSCRWRDGKYPIAGITDFRALFLLEMMAGDVGLRVVYRAHHLESNGTRTHRVFGPAERRGAIRSRLSGAGADWARSAAGVALGWPEYPTNVAPGGSNVLSAGIQALGPGTLISWIIR